MKWITALLVLYSTLIFATPNLEESFLQKIREAPLNDTYRLQFADWLEANGNRPRAEFIRIDIN